MHKNLRLLAIPIAMMLMVTACGGEKTKYKIEVGEAVPIITYKTLETPISCNSERDAIRLTEAEVELISLVTMAEAEGESEDGKRLVIDTILNRIDSDRFPDTVYDVIYQVNQFSSMRNGRVERCEVREDICQLVREELKFRVNYDVMFFTAGDYSDYGTPMFKVGNHYFSSYA